MKCSIPFATMYICVIKMWNKTIHHIMYLNRQNKKKTKKETKLFNSVGRKSKKNISKSIDEREREKKKNSREGGDFSHLLQFEEIMCSLV